MLVPEYTHNVLHVRAYYHTYTAVFYKVTYSGVAYIMNYISIQLIVRRVDVFRVFEVVQQDITILVVIIHT
jgi:hypothetical protein